MLKWIVHEFSDIFCIALYLHLFYLLMFMKLTALMYYYRYRCLRVVQHGI